MKRYLQTLCVILCSIGIICELIFVQDVWATLITAGALAFAVSSKIDARPTRNEINPNKEV